MRRVLGTIDTRTTFLLEPEFARILRDSAKVHPLNLRLAKRIEALLRQGVTRVAATIDPQSISEHDYVVEDGRLVFVTDDPELDLLIEAPELADEAFFVTADQLDLQSLSESAPAA